MLQWGSSYCNIHQWFPRNKLQARALGTLIRNAPATLTKGVCTSWLYLIAGFGSNQLDKAMLPLIFGHFPAGSSYKQIIHYGQSVQSGEWRLRTRDSHCEITYRYFFIIHVCAACWVQFTFSFRWSIQISDFGP